MLINGRRVAPFASGSGTGGVNINNIPLAGIERVEVLKDGASAIYGADAIAGVINFIMASNYQGAEVQHVRVDAHAERRRPDLPAERGAGFGDYDKDRFNVTMTAQYSNKQALFAKDRSFAKTGNLPPYHRGRRDRPGQHRRRLYPRHRVPATGTGSRARAAWLRHAPGYGLRQSAGGAEQLRIDQHVQESDEHVGRPRARLTARIDSADGRRT